jgi:membrane glycosyltransferase
MFLVLATVCGSLWLLMRVVRPHGISILEWWLVIVFVPLVYQLATGFWLAFYGLWSRRKGDPLDLRKNLPPLETAPPLGSATAIVMPIYNEDVTRVFEGLRAMFVSLRETGRLQHFDFFVLSDSDSPNKWIEEEVAWLELCRQLDAFGKIFYRKRRLPLNKKSGNIADFCRRWGKRYRYMLVLDADSLMTGERMLEMTRIMEAHPELGILQTAPKIIAADTLFGRLIQFAQSIYGEPYMNGLNYLQMGDATFWGHNAIVRLAPFIEFCGLPVLPGKTRILSHDFVEAALMRKAGYWVWLVPADSGSYEETPPSLIDFLKRERRWCQGNMQHFWLLFAKDIKRQSRLHFFHGILGYVASPLWLSFLLLATALASPLGAPKRDPSSLSSAVKHVIRSMTTEATKPALILLAVTFSLLFVPKIAIIAYKFFTGARDFGGRLRLVLSGLLDTILFTILAPIAMIFRSRFVWAVISGQGVKWVAQRRKSSDGVDWREPIITFAGVTAIAIGWGLLAWNLSEIFFIWISPVLIGMVLAIPFAIFTAGNSLSGLFLVPEEINPPPLLLQLQKNLRAARQTPQWLPELARHDGLMQALLDPYINALHISLLRQRPSAPPRSKLYLETVRTRLIAQGPDALTPREIKALLYDPDVMLRLHYDLWSAEEKTLAPWWTLAMRQYNVFAAEPPTAIAS